MLLDSGFFIWIKILFCSGYPKVKDYLNAKNIYKITSKNLLIILIISSGCAAPSAVSI